MHLNTRLWVTIFYIHMFFTSSQTLLQASSVPNQTDSEVSTDLLPQLPEEIAATIFACRDQDNIDHLESLPLQAATLVELRRALAQNEKDSLHAQAPDLWLKLHADLIFNQAGAAALCQQEGPHQQRFFTLLHRCTGAVNQQFKAQLTSAEEWTLHGYTLILSKYLMFPFMKLSGIDVAAFATYNTIAKEILAPILHANVNGFNTSRERFLLLRKLKVGKQIRQEAKHLSQVQFPLQPQAGAKRLRFHAQLIGSNIARTPWKNLLLGVITCIYFTQQSPTQMLENSYLLAFSFWLYLCDQHSQAKARLTPQAQQNILYGKAFELFFFIYFENTEIYTK
ncbi:MAG: hypothetical protein OXT67_10525, partial [Zetaproteobacteria bacterium]|nr:hypothetical protein [Zetaproteobacteria bacterium]